MPDEAEDNKRCDGGLSQPLLSSEDEEEEASSLATPQNDDANTNNMSRPTITCALATAVSIASLPTFLFGYCTACLNAIEPVVFPGHTTAQWAAAVSSFCLGGIVGARYAGSIADGRGRRWGLLGVGWIYIGSGIMHVFAGNIAVLIFARAIVGIGGGASTVLTPMYLGEISPLAIRGSIGMMTQISVVFGILASILVALPFATESEWRFVFLPIPAIGLLQLFPGGLLLPESPRWLRMKGREDAARAVLDRFSGSRLGVDEFEADGGSSVEMIPGDERTISGREAGEGDHDDQEVADTAESLENSDSVPELPVVEGSDTFSDFFFHPKNRIPVVSSLLFPIAQQLSGVNAVFYYSSMFFEGVITNPMTGTILAFSINVLATLFALPLVDRFGRKTLLCWSTGGMFVCCILLTLALLGILPNNMAVVSVLIYITFFELGLGCIPFFLVSELIEPKFFGRMQSLAMTTNWLCNFLVGMLFPFMVESLGSFSFVPFSMALLLAFVYAIVWLPETRGRPLEDVLAGIERRQTGGRQRVALSAPSEDDDAVFV